MWKALAPPQPVFGFDFNTPDPLTAFQPASLTLNFPISTAGVCNAVAFWFKLTLDEHTQLSSSPYETDTAGQAHTTWKQVSGGRHVDVLLCQDTIAYLNSSQACNNPLY